METNLIQIDRSGFFPEENESKIHFLLSYQDLFSRFKRESVVMPELVAAKKRFYALFSTIPCWVKAEVTSKGMLPWEVSVCWQYPDGQSLLRMRRTLATIKEEDRIGVLLHELVHASRARIKSICFEELMAYEVMKKAEISPIYVVRSILSRCCIAPSDSKAILFWHLLLFLLVMMGSISFGSYCALIGFFWSSLIVRGWWLLSLWKRAFATIEEIFPGKAWPFLLRATDRDVLYVASLKKEEAQESIAQRASTEWRWEYLKSCVL